MLVIVKRLLIFWRSFHTYWRKSTLFSNDELLIVILSFSNLYDWIFLVFFCIVRYLDKLKSVGFLEILCLREVSILLIFRGWFSERVNNFNKISLLTCLWLLFTALILLIVLQLLLGKVNNFWSIFLRICFRRLILNVWWTHNFYGLILISG